MGIAAPKPCTKHPNVLLGVNQKCIFCERNKQKAAKAYDKKRGTSSTRGYTAKWRRLTRQFLFDHPICKCGANANTVDHIKPHRGDSGLFWDRNNWQALCRSCHSRKTARYDGGFGNG